MSECRSGIGSHNLPVSTDGHYTVGPAVVTDLELFDRRIECAADEPLAEQAAAYRCALDLVTGKILTYPSRAGSSFGWTDTENLRSQWALRIQDRKRAVEGKSGSVRVDLVGRRILKKKTKN